MDTPQRSAGWKLSRREIRLLFYLSILLAIAAWRFMPRPWKPAFTLETPHYSIASTAGRDQAEDMALIAEGVFLVYSNLLRDLPSLQPPPHKLQLRLYRDRSEFQRINPGVGWAEAFYRRPRCHAYHDSDQLNPHQWMLHEAVHQLSEEFAHLDLEQWLDEGLAEYFATSQLQDHTPVLGQVDRNTYPVWWLDEMATSGDLSADLANGSVIPLRAIVSSRGGPSLNRQFNLYYLHWWSLTHFLFETPRHRSVCLQLIRERGRLEAFERLVGPVDGVQRAWYAHVRELKASLALNAPAARQSRRQQGTGPNATERLEGPTGRR